MDHVRRAYPALYGSMKSYIVGVSLVRRSSPESSALGAAVDVSAATFGLWQPGMGHFVGSSTGHLGILWIEEGLALGDLVCGLAHEFAHFALNLADMSTGVFTSAAYDGSVSAMSPLLRVRRPYALAMHALMVQSVLGHLGLRMSTDPPEDFDFARAAACLDPSAGVALTPRGRALFGAVRAHEQGGGVAGPLRLPACPRATWSYAARHVRPTLLFWGGTQAVTHTFELCFVVVPDTGAVVFDGVRLVRRETIEDYALEAFSLEGEALASEFSVEKMSFAEYLLFCARDKHGSRAAAEPGDIFERGELTVEEPWETRYADVARDLGSLSRRDWAGGPPVGQRQILRLPCGQVHEDAVADAELTVAAACGLPPRQILTVTLEPSGESFSLAGYTLSGGQLGRVAVADAESTSFRAVQGELADACGLSLAAVCFVTAGGTLLLASQRSRSVGSIFGSASA